MNTNLGMIWNINASLFLAAKDVRALRHFVAALQRQLAAEQKACDQLRDALLSFTRELRNYADSLPGADTTPCKNGTRKV